MLLAVQAAAVVVEVQLPYEDLRLKDGAQLTEVVIKSFNTSAGTALLQVRKDLISVRMSLLPDEVSARLKELAPVLTKEEQEAEKKQEAEARQLAARNAEHHQQQAEDEVRADRAASRQLNVQAREQSDKKKADRLLEDVAVVAEARARVYFKYEDDPFSNIGAVVSGDLSLSAPELVPGWAGRYRVTGTAYRQYINNRSSGFGRGHKDFEILIDTADKGKPKVVDISVK
jgi:hypothetical protein